MTENNFRKSKRRVTLTAYAPLILWLALIFYLSSGQGSMTETSRFIRPFLEWLFPLAAPETLSVYHGYIRKSAHFFIYAGLAFWARRAFKNSANDFLRKNYYFCSFALVALVAAIDETNQSFNAARTGTIYDVLLDASGGLTMLLIIYFLERRVSVARA